MQFLQFFVLAGLNFGLTELLKLQKSGQFPYEPVRIKV
jgi:hypothetical protein